MRLLTKTQVQDKKQAEQATLARKGLRIAELVDKHRKELNDLKTRKSQEAHDFEQEVALKKKALQEELVALNNEVAARRAERAELLKPVKDIQNRANQMLSEAQQKEADLLVKEQEIIEKQQHHAHRVELLQDRIDSLTSWEELIAERDNAVALREKVFISDCEKVSKEIEHQKSSLSLKAIQLAHKESELGEREGAIRIALESIKLQEGELEKQKVKLISERHAIKLAWEELKQNG